jgi:hypothetical protein
MGKGYGIPDNELTIRQMEPDVARGNPLAVINGGRIVMIVPVSGGPAAPGVITTAAPIVTGGPGIVLFKLLMVKKRLIL